MTQQSTIRVVNNKDKTDAFDSIVAGLDEDMTCVHVSGCNNRVCWLVQFHGCGDFLLCDPHVKSWLFDSAAVFAQQPGPVTCLNCGRKFAAVEYICAVRPV